MVYSQNVVLFTNCFSFQLLNMDERTREELSYTQCINATLFETVPNPLYFVVLKHEERPFLKPFNIIEVQIRFNGNLRRQLSIHKCCINYKIWTTLTASPEAFLDRFKYIVMNYLDNLGMISINNVVKAVQYFYDRYANHILQIEQTESIMFNLF